MLLYYDVCCWEEFALVFSNSVFLFVFFPIVLVGYYLLQGKARNYWLLIISLVFYGWNKLDFLWILIASILLNYVSALLVASIHKKGIKLLVLWLGVAGNLLLLFYFKYFNFTISIIEKLFQRSFSFAEVILPIGISFFTFQSLSYVVDVYRGEVEVQRNPFKLGMYVALFPQLVAGPIVRYRDVAKEIDDRTVTLDDFATGSRRFIIGLFKKIIIADTLAVTADAIVAASYTASNLPINAWIGIVSYSLQLFFDFSGYSDMAIGLGRMFGFHFLENFDYPYISKSITEFWRRWHISLSSFFRDYVYIPLGGNRRHVYLNVAIVFLLTGIWHGASFSFILWGMWHGMFNMTERWIRQRNANKPQKEHSPVVAGLISALQHIYTLLVVMIGWIFFRIPGLKNGLNYLLSLVGLRNNFSIAYLLPSYYLDRWTLCVLVLGILMATPLPKRLIETVSKKIPAPVGAVIRDVALLAALLLCILQVASNTYSAFIYFQF